MYSVDTTLSSEILDLMNEVTHFHTPMTTETVETHLVDGIGTGTGDNLHQDRRTKRENPSNRHSDPECRPSSLLAWKSRIRMSR